MRVGSNPAQGLPGCVFALYARGDKVPFGLARSTAHGKVSHRSLKCLIRRNPKLVGELPDMLLTESRTKLVIGALRPLPSQEATCPPSPLCCSFATDPLRLPRSVLQRTVEMIAGMRPASPGGSPS